MPSWRKNIASGCITRRPCFCALAAVCAQLLCPARALWPLIRRRVGPDSPLFRAANRRDFNRILKAIMHQIHTPEASRYIPPRFPHGGYPGIKGILAPWSAVAASGLWNSPAVRGYRDMSRDVEIGAQQLFDVDIDSESDAEYVRRWDFIRETPWPGFIGRFSACIGASGFPVD